MIEILAALSASAAAGMRIALPLLVIGLLYGDLLWSQVPVLSGIAPPVILGVLVSWSLFEVFASKVRLGRQLLHVVELLFSPFAGAILGIAVARAALLPGWVIATLGVVGGLLALVLQLVQIGVSYRMRQIPLWTICAQDVLCVILVLFSFDAPRQGGLIALMLLWMAIRTSKDWHRWYVEQANPADRRAPRRGKRDPD
jgi:hypothetical protein